MSATPKLPAFARLGLGLIFFVFGLNGFLSFLPMPPLDGGAGAFMGALAETGYMFPLIKGVEVVAGAALLAGVFVPLALLLLAPIVVNIAMFHLVLAPASLPLVVVILALGSYLAYAYRDAFAGVLQRKALPLRKAETSRPAPTRVSDVLAAR